MTQQRIAWILAALLAAYLLVRHALSYDFLADDALISLRYARNWLAGEGLVYNSGQYVEGYSNFLWVVLTAGLGGCGIDLILAARCLGALCGLACAGASALLFLRLLPAQVRSSMAPLALLAPLLLAGHAPTACWMLSGLETPGYACAIVFALWLAGATTLSRGAAIGIGVLLTAVAWLRPEGIAVGLGVCALTGVRCWRGGLSWRLFFWMVGSFSLLVGAHLLWRMSYYGDLLPNTYYAKVSANADQFGRGLTYLADYARDHGGAFVYLLPFVAVIWRRDYCWWSITAILTGLAAMVVYVGGDGLPMHRFVVPLAPLWAVLFASLVADGLVWAANTGRESRQWAVRGLGAAAALWLFVTWAVPDERSFTYRSYEGQQEYEVPAWTAAGHWLAANAEPGDTVACVPIGAIGYYSGLHVHDMMGLVDPHIAHRSMPLGRGWAGHEKHDGPYILSLEPTYLLLGNVRVLPRPMPIGHPEFVRVDSPAIEAREGDIYTPELQRCYEPVVVRLPEGGYLHLLRRRLSMTELPASPPRRR